MNTEQKWPSHVVIVRHGQSERNVEKKKAHDAGAHSYGPGLRDMDTPLTRVGHEQSIITGTRLNHDHKFDVVFVSPYRRTRETADDLIEQFSHKPRMVSEERIREIEFGILDGFTTAGIKAKYPDEHERRKREGKYWYRPPGGESRPDVALRVHSFLGTLTRDYRKKSVLIVCHSVVVLIFRRLLERWNEDDYMKIDKEDDVKNCGVTTYHCDAKHNKLALDYYNRTFYPEP